MSSESVELRRTLGGLTNSDWSGPLETVRREHFLGEAVFRPAEGPEGPVWEPIRRDRVHPDRWLAMAYVDETWVTQVNGVMAEDATGAMTGAPTSSSTKPSLVVRMLERAGIGEDDRVLEIGTGTGYSTGLMCERLGDSHVTSVEFDPAVAGRARSALRTAGYTPTLLVGDGLSVYDEDAEYDRLIATCSVRYVPVPWLWQVRDGGTITTPLSGWMSATVLAHLTLADDGTAAGRFLPDEFSFMFARAHDRPPRSHYLLGIGEERDSLIDPRVLEDPTGLFVAQLAAPSAEKLGMGDRVILLDVATGSQCSTEPLPGGGWKVRQHGPLRLWDAVEQAISTWQSAGSPGKEAFGLTVTRDSQRVWLGDPSSPSWNLPA